MNNTMGVRIKECRLRAQMTREELANILGVKEAAIYKYENGLVQNIPRTSIAKMAKLFDVRPSWLMGLDPEERTEDIDIDEFLNSIKTRPEMRMLFSVAKGATAEDIKRAVSIIEALSKIPVDGQNN